MMALRYCTTAMAIRSGLVRRISPAIVPSRSYANNEGEVKDLAKAAAPAGEIPKGNLGMRDHHVNKFDKLLLVWGGKYKSFADVPDLVSQDSLERARNKARIKINISMGVATLLGCFFMIYLGKKDAREGKSVTKMNEEWHRRIKEEAMAKEKAIQAERSG